jgi:hypothetical protein
VVKIATEQRNGATRAAAIIEALAEGETNKQRPDPLGSTRPFHPKTKSA